MDFCCGLIARGHTWRWWSGCGGLGAAFWESTGQLWLSRTWEHSVTFWTIYYPGRQIVLIWIQANQPQVFLPLTPSCCKHAQHLHLLKRLRAFETHNSILIQSKPKSMTLGSPLGPRLRWLKRERAYNTLSFPGNLSFNLQHARGGFSCCSDFSLYCEMSSISKVALKKMH